MKVKRKNFVSAISPETGGERDERSEQGYEAAEEDERLAAAGEPRLGPVEVLVGQEDVPADPVDQRPAAVATDAVAGGRIRGTSPRTATMITDHQVERLARGRGLSAREDTP